LLTILRSSWRPLADIKLIKNSVDVKELKTYQQLFLYFVPTVANAGFINLIVVVVRLHWFEKRLKKLGMYYRPSIAFQFDLWFLVANCV
jgi:hypothetical protein